MSISMLLRQIGTIYPKIGNNKFGREIRGTAIVVKCRFQNITKTRLIKEGQTVQIIGTVYFSGDTTINIEDRFAFNGNDYKVFSVNGSIDGRGNQRIIRCELQKWQI